MSFAKLLNDAHKVTGEMRASEICPDELTYHVTCTTPFGSIVDQPYSAWEFLCDFPADGWALEYLTLVNWLTAAPMRTLYIGAGSGRMVKWLLGSMDCVGIDWDDDAIDLMNRRSIPSAKMDGRAMTYRDNSFARVVVPADLDDVVASLPEAARVASDRVVVTGYEMDPDEAVAYTWGFTWDGGSVPPQTYYAYPVSEIEALLVGLGMTLVSRTKWSDDDAGPEGNIFGIQYLIEAKW